MLPNFLIVGAAKCGTTSLYRYLSQHPDVFMPRWKELSLFIGDPHGPLHRVKKPAYYHMVFDGVRGENAIGEASTGYLYDQASPALIKEHLGPIKIIISLRNPVDMAYSLYSHQLRKEGEHLASFEAALQAEEERYHSKQFRRQCYGWHANYYYFRRGLYHDQVKRYLDTFGRDNVLVLLFDELVTDPVGITREVYRFIGVQDDYLPEIRVHNRGGKLFNVPEFWEDRGLLQKTVSFVFSRNLLRKLPLLVAKRNLGPAPAINPYTARKIAARYLNDIHRLEALIGKDLGHWKAAYPKVENG
jgi:hypothetical protein